MGLKLTLGNGDTNISHLTFCAQFLWDWPKKKYGKREDGWEKPLGAWKRLPYKERLKDWNCFIWRGNE